VQFRQLEPRPAPPVGCGTVLTEAHDPVEREADRVARGRRPGALHGRPVAASGGPVDPAVARRIREARGGGRPLPDAVRARMEGTFGAGLGDVRVHTGVVADRLNRRLDAVAFTAGADVFFRDGRFRPDSPAGERLLAHELTHVAQQRGGQEAVMRQLNPQHLNHPPNQKKSWKVDSGVFDPRNGTHKWAKRAGTVEAVIPGGMPTTGTKPNKETVLGWHWVHQFGGTEQGHGGWVRFHLLNENLNGSGDTKLNLVPTSARTNHDREWTTDFDEVAKDAHRRGRHLHFVARVHYHQSAAATQANPGLPYLDFFPRRIEAKYREWRNGWQDLANADLTGIPRPPVNATEVPVYLDYATGNALLRYKTLDKVFREILTDPALGIQVDLHALPPVATMQDVYDVINRMTAFKMCRKQGYNHQSQADNQRWFDTKSGWWPTLEALLARAAGARPLRVNDTLPGPPQGVATTDTAKAPAAAPKPAPKPKPQVAATPAFSIDTVLSDFATRTGGSGGSGGGAIRSTYSSRKNPQPASWL
jgi:Domain of unknown function (DUF4157)